MKNPPRFAPGKHYIMSGKTLNEMADAVQARTIIAGPGVRLREIPQGVVVSTIGSSSGCPFSGALLGADFKFSSPGTLNALVPVNMFDAGALVSIPAVVPGYINLDVETEDNNVQSCTLAASATSPDPIPTGDGVAPGSFSIPLYQINAAGDVFRLFGCGSLWAYAYEAFLTSNPTPDACGDPYIRHYTWRVDTV